MRWLGRTLIELPFCWCLCTTEKQFEEALNALGVPKNNRPSFLASTNADATTHLVAETKEANKTVIICLGPTKGYSKTEILGLLVHEVTHVWQAVRDHYTEDSPSSEFEAYALQYLSQTVIAEYEKQLSQPARKSKHRSKRNATRR